MEDVALRSEENTVSKRGGNKLENFKHNQLISPLGTLHAYKCSEEVVVQNR